MFKKPVPTLFMRLEKTTNIYADSDGDLMPDGWEVLNGLNPHFNGDAGLDSDGDGLSNLLEFQYGTDPQDADTDGDVSATDRRPRRTDCSQTVMATFSQTAGK